MSQHERDKIEEILLRWRGVKKMGVQLVKQQSMRLKNMKYAPKAELAPMRGLGPSGPAVEEGRISLADQNQPLMFFGKNSSLSHPAKSQRRPEVQVNGAFVSGNFRNVKI